MGLSVLEDHKLEHVPGTSSMRELNPTSEPSEITLKYDPVTKITLVPQPTDDPNDPLNWPLWRRDCILAILSVVTVLCTSMSSVMAADTVVIAEYDKITFVDAALLTGYHLAGVGVTGILIVPTARVWGKRHLFLIGHFLMIVSCVWAGTSGHNYRSLLWARVFQGVALAPFEALINPCVGDLYFVHQRGKRMAMTNMSLFGGAFLTPVIVGKLTRSLGWQWSFYFVAIFLGLALPFTIFFVPETAFRQPVCLNADISHAESTDPGSELASGSVDLNATSLAGEYGASIPKKDSWAKSMRLLNGRKTDDHFLKLLLRPFPLFFHPGVLWACLTQGVLVGWVVFIGVILAVLFEGPPLWFTEEETGYLYAGAFIGSIAGFTSAGFMTDLLNNKLLIPLNKGIYEPEFRLVLVSFQLILCTVGLFGFGVVANNIVGGHSVVILEVYFACIIAGMVIGAVAASLYIVDAHGGIAVEAFTCMLVFKNLFSFALTFSAYGWFTHGGFRYTMIIIGAIQVGICLLSIPMYHFGKRNRSFFARHDILKMLNLG